MRRAWPWLIAALIAVASPAAAAERWDSVPDPASLPKGLHEHHLQRPGASLWYATAGKGTPVVLLHCGDGSSDLWGEVVTALIGAGHRVILVDTRGHGRSTWDGSALHYEAMADDVLAVMQAQHLQRASVVGWSDGAIVSLILSMKAPKKLSRVYAFGANMDLDGFNLAGALAPTLGPSDALMAKVYARVSPRPDDWNALKSAVFFMQLREPTFSPDQLAAIHGPRIAIVDGDHEEFIARTHTEYMARTIPGAKLVLLPEVGHFAPLEDPKGFAASVIKFLGR